MEVYIHLCVSYRFLAFHVLGNLIEANIMCPLEREVWWGDWVGRRALCTRASQEEGELLTLVNWRLQEALLLQVACQLDQDQENISKAGIWRGVRGDSDQVPVGRRRLCQRNCLQRKLLLREQLANRSSGVQVLFFPASKYSFLRTWPSARASHQRFSPDRTSSRPTSTSASRRKLRSWS